MKERKKERTENVPSSLSLLRRPTIRIWPVLLKAQTPHHVNYTTWGEKCRVALLAGGDNLAI